MICSFWGVAGMKELKLPVIIRQVRETGDNSRQKNRRIACLTEQHQTQPHPVLKDMRFVFVDFANAFDHDYFNSSSFCPAGFCKGVWLFHENSRWGLSFLNCHFKVRLVAKMTGRVTYCDNQKIVEDSKASISTLLLSCPL